MMHDIFGEDRGEATLCEGKRSEAKPPDTCTEY